MSDEPRPIRLHTGGTFRRRLARAFGRDESAGDLVSRRIVHVAGALVLVYYPMPEYFFVVVSKEVALLLALAAMFGLEVARLGFHAELPTIRGYEARRPASYLFYSVALVAAILLFPPPIAVAVILGTAVVDPLAGEMRGADLPLGRSLGVSFLVYTALATVALAGVGRWPWEAALGLGGAAAAVGVAVERWRFRWLDDDLTMTIVPAVALYAVGVVAFGLPR